MIRKKIIPKRSEKKSILAVVFVLLKIKLDVVVDTCFNKTKTTAKNNNKMIRKMFYHS